MKTTVFCGVSVDGFIARPDGSVDFLDAFDPPLGADGEPSDMGFTALMASVDALIMGRNTFDTVLRMMADGAVDWPYGETPVIVMTSRPLDVPAELNDVVEATDLPPKELLEVLSARFFEHVYVDGGQTVQSFLAAGLIDELSITTVPILIGEGLKLFGELPADLRLERVGGETFSNGMVQNNYEMAATADG